MTVSTTGLGDFAPEFQEPVDPAWKWAAFLSSIVTAILGIAVFSGWMGALQCVCCAVLVVGLVVVLRLRVVVCIFFQHFLFVSSVLFCFCWFVAFERKRVHFFQHFLFVSSVLFCLFVLFCFVLFCFVLFCFVCVVCAMHLRGNVCFFFSILFVSLFRWFCLFVYFVGLFCFVCVV